MLQFLLTQIGKLKSKISAVGESMGGVTFKTFKNANSISIDLGVEPGTRTFGMVYISNANQNVVFGLDVSNNIVIRNWSGGTITISAAVEGSVLTITPSSTLWGDTICYFHMNK